MNDKTAEPKQSETPSRRKTSSVCSAQEEPASSHLGARLRGYFLTGLIVVGPVAITLYVVWWFINLVDAWVKPLIPKAYLPETYLPFNVPGVGLIVGIFGLMVVGALTANLFGRTIVSYGEMMLDRMPVVRGVYRLLKQIFTTVFSKSGTSFKRVGLIEFPRRGLYCTRLPRRRSAAGGRGQDRRRQAAHHRVHAERAEPHHRLHRLHAGKEVILLDLRSRTRPSWLSRPVWSGPTAAGRVAQARQEPRRRSRCPRKSRWFSRQPARISLIASSRSNR